jgi:hypothetical protein
MSNTKMGKSGALRATTAAASRALMTQDMVAGRRETPDVGVSSAPVAVHAPKVAAFLKSRSCVLAA